MHKIEANEIVGTTFHTIDKIGESKYGGDMLLLYFAYIKQSRIQETNQSRSLDVFMQKKMGRGKDRFRNAKNGLKDLGLIDVIQIRGEDGKVKTWYVKTNFMINEQKIRTHNHIHEIDLSVTTHPENQTPEIPASGETATNALSTKHKCLNNIKHIYMFDDFWKAYPRKKNKAKAEIAYKKAIDSGVKHEDIMQGLVLYKEEIIRDKTEAKHIKRPQGWLNDRRREDEHDVGIPITDTTYWFPLIDNYCEKHGRPRIAQVQAEWGLSEEDARILYLSRKKYRHDKAIYG